MKRDQAKQLAQDALAELQADLKEGRSKTLERFLKVMGRFHHYSWNNCLLIASQKPDATHVAGFRKWQEVGRHVRKGEHGIRILAPVAYRRMAETDEDREASERRLCGFRIVHVFDVSQTEGEELPELAQVTGEAGELLQRLEALVRADGIRLTVERLPIGTQGVARKGAIAIAQGLESAEHFAVLVHELAHTRLHDRERCETTSTTVRETEAEAVAYAVCHAFGFDSSTRSSDYIQLYRGDVGTLTESLHAIQATACQIIDALRPDNVNACAVTSVG